MHLLNRTGLSLSKMYSVSTCDGCYETTHQTTSSSALKDLPSCLGMVWGVQRAGMAVTYWPPTGVQCCQHHMIILSCKNWGTNETAQEIPLWPRALWVSQPAPPDCSWDDWRLLYRTQIRGVKHLSITANQPEHVALKVKICVVISGD